MAPPPVLLPAGTYRCLLRDRRIGADNVTLVLEVEQGPYRCGLIGCRVTESYRVRKAADLDGTSPVIIQVAHRRSRSGFAAAYVRGFWQVRPWETMTVLGGMPAGDHGTVELAALHYNTQKDIELLQFDLHAMPEGHTPWAAPLMAEQLAHDLRLALRGGDAATTDEYEDLVEPLDADATWCGRTQQRVATEYPYGVLTVADGGQRLVQYEPAFTAFCRMEAPRDVVAAAGISAFQHDKALVDHVRLGGVIGDYRSPAWSRWIPVRFDVPGDAAESLARCRRFVTALERLDVPSKYVMVFADGSGALEVMFPSASFGTLPRPGFEIVAGYLCMFIADWSVFCDEVSSGPTKDQLVIPEGNITIDLALYRPMASLAMPNARAGSGDTYKVRVMAAELLSMDSDGLARLARQPRPFDPPPWDVAAYEMLAHVWQFCVAVAVCRSQTVSQATMANRWIHEKTFDFLRCGAAPDELDARVFTAAMNLCDFRCPEPLLEALLGPVAFSCGMTVTKFKRTLTNAIRKSRLARPMPIEAPPDAWFTRTKSIDE
jgi:hypothetical protein